MNGLVDRPPPPSAAGLPRGPAPAPHSASPRRKPGGVRFASAMRALKVEDREWAPPPSRGGGSPATPRCDVSISEALEDAVLSPAHTMSHDTGVDRCESGLYGADSAGTPGAGSRKRAKRVVPEPIKRSSRTKTPSRRLQDAPALAGASRAAVRCAMCSGVRQKACTMRYVTSKRPSHTFRFCCCTRCVANVNRGLALGTTMSNMRWVATYNALDDYLTQMEALLAARAPGQVIGDKHATRLAVRLVAAAKARKQRPGARTPGGRDAAARADAVAESHSEVLDVDGPMDDDQEAARSLLLLVRGEQPQEQPSGESPGGDVLEAAPQRPRRRAAAAARSFSAGARDSPARSSSPEPVSAPLSARRRRQPRGPAGRAASPACRAPDAPSPAETPTKRARLESPAPSLPLFSPDASAGCAQLPQAATPPPQHGGAEEAHVPWQAHPPAPDVPKQPPPGHERPAMCRRCNAAPVLDAALLHGLCADRGVQTALSHTAPVYCPGCALTLIGDLLSGRELSAAAGGASPPPGAPHPDLGAIGGWPGIAELMAALAASRGGAAKRDGPLGAPPAAAAPLAGGSLRASGLGDRGSGPPSGRFLAAMHGAASFDAQALSPNAAGVGATLECEHQVYTSFAAASAAAPSSSHPRSHCPMAAARVKAEAPLDVLRSAAAGPDAIGGACCAAYRPCSDAFAVRKFATMPALLGGPPHPVRVAASLPASGGYAAAGGPGGSPLGRHVATDTRLWAEHLALPRCAGAAAATAAAGPVKIRAPPRGPRPGGASTAPLSVSTDTSTEFEGAAADRTASGAENRIATIGSHTSDNSCEHVSCCRPGSP